MSAAKKAPKRSGILAGGNWIIDQVKMIDVYPQREQLANITGVTVTGTGGSPYNLLINLAKLGANIPLAAAGLVGKDAFGDLILADCAKHKIDTKHLKATPAAPTSYTDVMTETKGGNRTFFHNRGANAHWGGTDIDFKKTKARFFHLGYLLLLDEMDSADKNHGTKAAKLLAAAQAAGLRTSIDAVSEDSDRFAKIVTPALQYTDYCILNEIEAGKTTGFKIRQDDGKLDTVALRHAAGALLQMGVGELVVIHFPEGGFVRTRKGEDVLQSSLRIPAKDIVGAAGAGDAFCTGMLLGLHEEWDLAKCLETAVCAAAACLSDPSCTGGMKPRSAVCRHSPKNINFAQGSSRSFDKKNATLGQAGRSKNNIVCGELFVHALHVFSFTRVYFQPLAVLDEEWRLDGLPGLEGDGFHHVRCGVTFHAFRGIGYGEHYTRRQFQHSRVALDERDLDLAVLDHVIHRIADQFRHDCFGFVRFRIGENEVFAVAIAVLHLAAVERNHVDFLCGTESSVERFSRANAAQRGLHKRTRLWRRAMVALQHDGYLALVLDGHSFA